MVLSRPRHVGSRERHVPPRGLETGLFPSAGQDPGATGGPAWLGARLPQPPREPGLTAPVDTGVGVRSRPGSDLCLIPRTHPDLRQGGAEGSLASGELLRSVALRGGEGAGVTSPMVTVLTSASFGAKAPSACPPSGWWGGSSGVP